MGRALAIIGLLSLALEACCPPCRCPQCPVVPSVPTPEQPATRVVPEPPEPEKELPPLPIDHDDLVVASPATPPPDLPMRNGLVIPYPLDNPLRGYGKCRRGKRRHPAFDIGGVGEHGGLGTPIRSMARAKVTLIGRGATDPKKFGRPDRRRGKAQRGSRSYPRSMTIPGYGRVYFFTRNYGSWRSGTILSTRVVEGPYKGYEIRYMHLGEIHPALKVGDIVEAGQEIALMGATAIQESGPHVHIDMSDTRDRRVDVKALLGLDTKHGPCR